MIETPSCIGCGAEIQTENPNELGYAPPSSLEKETIICQRCFRLKNYNEIQPVSLTDDDFLRILNGLGEQEGLIVKIVDIFDFNGSWLPGLHRFVGKNPVLLVANKADLLPKSVKPKKVVNWLKREAKSLGLQPIDVLLVSAHKGLGMGEVIDAIETHRQGKDVFVVGCTNVGKSTFINRIIKQATGEGNVITTSHFPGTTLDMIEIPLDDGAALYDTPGIINHHQMAHHIDSSELKFITPKKEIKPKVYQQNEGQTLFIGALARFDFIKGERSAFTIYAANDLPIHRTKLERADSLYSEHKGELLAPPSKEYIDQLPELVRHEFSIKEGKTDVVISGLGWITVQHPNVVVAAHAPKGVEVFIRPSLI
ncbi:ribosome biogenesis GTPase YqeH [Lysinibacillus composti]|uniref:Ribosome biogenesis GTPase YqeH n=1 Tax=Lysinibacillus composti TaxID=720633 RepID=A0A3N9UVB7_9BACI|nr:ribosome biogenesis GTPase YqeH [Lysinibacillus composti]MBM7607010.1 ribosome biogenesis GTPase YqeH [Lysinibacillus composti]RQW76392.1 ribosome biogenesis GTPase YqeH [Lysinibacillus composti]